MESKENKYLKLPLYIFTFLFVFFPLLYMLFISFDKKDIFKNYINILNPLYIEVFIASFKLAILSTVIIFILAYPFAYFMSKLDNKYKKNS